MDVFETAKDHCEELRTELQKRQSENGALLRSVVEQIRTKFTSYEGTTLADLSTPTTATLDAEIKLGESYSVENGLDEKLKQKAELEKATSKEGLKLLKGEAATLRALHGEVQPILNAAEKLIEIDPVSQSQTLNTKEDEQEILAKALIPSGANLDKLMALIRPANEICNLNEPKTAECPLCKQNLRESELELFKQYAVLLTGELDRVITELRELLKTAETNLKLIADSSPDDWAKDSVLAPETIGDIKKAGKEIKDRFKAGEVIDQECKDVASSLRDLSDRLLKRLEEKEMLIEEAGNNREELLGKLGKISAECQALLYAKEIKENIDLVREAHQQTQIAAFWDTNLPNFTTVLRKITSTAKKAYKELVVEDFKFRLNAEYIALAEKDMSAFGVELKDVGGEGTVTVDHHVAGERIETVLSEGEQRIHALALFFAELETCEQQVIIFDDPVSSFDYNYIANFCNRLRNLIQAHPNRQIIILTHNWDFFVQIQMTLNASRLNHHMAVHVLESCVAIDEYTENINDLEADIDAIMAIPGEPDKHQKEALGISGTSMKYGHLILVFDLFHKSRQMESHNFTYDL